MSDMQPTVTTRRRVSPLWIVPAVALGAGLWIVLHTWLTEGPTVTIRFATAEGLEEGKTQVKMLSVEVGLVEEVALNADASGVTATVRLDRQVEPLLREDTQFWVVRARVGASGVSGIGTILSGAYIELAPGRGETGRRRFVGLEAPPLTPAGSPGKHLILTSQQAGVSVGDPVLYRGFKVGRVESMDFVPQTEQAKYSIFVDAPYDQLIHSGTRFWDASGISVSATAEGFRLRVDSIDTLLLGGVTFGSPPGMERGADVPVGAEFQLYGTYDEILENPYREGAYYVVQFNQTVAGLLPNAPVTYRGVRVGRVERILLAEVGASEVSAPEVRVTIPVLIYLQPGLLKLPDEPESVSLLRDAIASGVSKGLRATLKTGNLLTGRKEVALDYFPAAADPVDLGEASRFRDYDVIPSVEAGADRIAVEVNTLLAKINSLPLEDTVVSMNRMLEQMEDALASIDTGFTSLNGIVSAPGTQQLPTELEGALRELRTVLQAFGTDSDVYTNLNASLANLDRTLESLDQLTRELSERPSSVIFGPANAPDPVPEAAP